MASITGQSKSAVLLRLAIALASVTFAATVEVLPSVGARLRVVLLLTAVWFGASLWIGRRALLDRPYRPAVLIALLLSYALVAASALAEGQNPIATDRLPAYCALSIGWATLFLLVGLRPDAVSGAVPLPSRQVVAALVGLSVLVLSVAHRLATPRWPIVSDEAIYVLQSEWFFRPSHSWSVPPEIADFFVMRKIGYNAEAQHFYGMYPPGWPAALALFDRIGLRWWTPVIAGALSVALTYVIGVRVHSRSAGIIAAALLAIQQWFVAEHAGYMSDGFFTFTTVAGAAALLAAETATGARRLVFAGLAGLTLGIGVTVRPLSGIAIGIALVLWILIRQRMTLRALLVSAAGLLIGAVLPAAFLLEYNAVTNGEPFRLGYQAINGRGYDLGFGVRGFRAYSGTLERIEVPIAFTPMRAVSHLFQRFADFAHAAFGIALLLPVLALAVAHRVSLRPRLAAPFFLLPIAYFFYWHSNVRFFTGLLPFLLIGISVLVLELMERDPWVTQGLVVSAFVGSLFFALPGRVTPRLASPWVGVAYFREWGRIATLDSLKALGERRGPLLVFARQQPNAFDTLLDRLQLLNADGLSSRVLVARDLGARNEQLRAHYPDRVAYIVEDRGREIVARIAPLEERPIR